MQEAGMSATLLTGLEGCYGLIMAIPLYFVVGPLAGFNPVDAIQAIGSSAFAIGYTIVLVFILFAFGLVSILSIAATSSMTRNMWKNFKGLVVWLIALAIFYTSGNTRLGEQWTTQGSLMLLSGFALMMVAIHVYYLNSNSDQRPASDEAK